MRCSSVSGRSRKRCFPTMILFFQRRIELKIFFYALFFCQLRIHEGSDVLLLCQKQIHGSVVFILSRTAPWVGLFPVFISTQSWHPDLGCLTYLCSVSSSSPVWSQSFLSHGHLHGRGCCYHSRLGSIIFYEGQTVRYITALVYCGSSH